MKNLYKILTVIGILTIVFSIITIPLNSQETELDHLYKQEKSLNQEILILNKEVNNFKIKSAQTLDLLEKTKTEKNPYQKIETIKEDYNQSYLKLRVRIIELDVRNSELACMKTDIDMRIKKYNKIFNFKILFILFGIIFIYFGIFFKKL